MTIELDEATRKQVAVFLPKAVEKTLKSYYRFVDLEEEGEPEGSAAKDKKLRGKLFSDHHSACKTALAHLELLFRLGRYTGVGTGDRDEELINLLKIHALDNVNDFIEKEFPCGGDNVEEGDNYMA